MRLELAQALIHTAMDLAKQDNINIAVAIADTHGELVHFARNDDVAIHAAKLAQCKAYTSARDKQSTKGLGQWARETGKDLGYWSDTRFTGIAGGVPIFQKSVSDQQAAFTHIGSIGISGMAEEDDHRFAEKLIEMHELSSSSAHAE